MYGGDEKCINLIGKPEEKRPVEAHIKEIACESVEWI
jgi:hypothetical protein